MEDVFFVRTWSSENDGQVLDVEYYYSTEELLNRMQELDEKKIKFDVFSSKCIYDKS